MRRLPGAVALLALLAALAAGGGPGLADDDDGAGPATTGPLERGPHSWRRWKRGARVTTRTTFELDGVEVPERSGETVLELTNVSEAAFELVRQLRVAGGEPTTSREGMRSSALVKEDLIAARKVVRCVKWQIETDSGPGKVADRGWVWLADGWVGPVKIRYFLAGGRDILDATAVAASEDVEVAGAAYACVRLEGKIEGGHAGRDAAGGRGGDDPAKEEEAPRPTVTIWATDALPNGIARMVLETKLEDGKVVRRTIEVSKVEGEKRP